MQYIHDRLKISHGDIDHENILVSRSGLVKIGKEAPFEVEGLN